MGPAYLFALVVGFGILLVQALMGSKETDGDAHGDADAHGELEAEGGDLHADADGDVDHDVDHDVSHDVDHDVDHDVSHDADHDVDHDVSHDVDHDAHHDVGGGHKELGTHGTEGQAGKDLSVVGGLAALLLSTRFWIFAFLGFGLSGTLLHYVFGSVSALATALTAIIAGLLSGLTASLAFRALRKTSSRTATNTTTAVGKVAKVLVPCTKDGLGQVRILLDGQTVDLPAKTTELRIERGDYVLIEEVDGDVAQVSKAPPEIEQ
jgi:membrane protein implicated in regulation of membrane protease activity